MPFAYPYIYRDNSKIMRLTTAYRVLRTHRTFAQQYRFHLSHRESTSGVTSQPSSYCKNTPRQFQVVCPQKRGCSFRGGSAIFWGGSAILLVLGGVSLLGKRFVFDALPRSGNQDHDQKIPLHLV